MKPSSPLNEILEVATRFSEGQLTERLTVVFDLDSTLFDLQPRMMAVIKDFAKDTGHAERFPKAVKIFSEIKELTNEYYFKNHLLKFGLWDQTREFYEHAFGFWKTRFFSHDYLEHDIPYVGAVEYVQKLHALGVHIHYLTGRDVERMGEGTRRVLRKWNFPLDEPNTRLILKPHKSIDDAEYKKDYLLEIEHTLGPIWFIENEPENIELALKYAPHVKIIFFDSIHSGRGSPLPPSIPTIKDFSLT
ncbi:MAG: HAD family hydrolase [Bdellovibrionales bacterium]|nr:HAD family hydrolase [Bdellovibrionales bacterium]